ncbi:Bacteriocin class II with double-glycine leader peptide [Halobacteroides halobius DSM 5150]|uniref:Bacteriocin class II with double-glycine leader peptide n=1 Tax=Halobacteroides halobius (strain ATCC 35273 / DSM 5150 / MD-1) TaxID=748449 RepID=L0KBX3_HALHC|nr:Blp family class II bacteriocin [Halobacteroides halobius]AGB41859.1 Bacteriocin class II with double-glycine leader peptide [Halobacteroides halobius DSM 5150]
MDNLASVGMVELNEEELMMVDGGFFSVTDLGWAAAGGAISGAITYGSIGGAPGAVAGAFTGAALGALDYLMTEAGKTVVESSF